VATFIVSPFQLFTGIISELLSKFKNSVVLRWTAFVPPALPEFSRMKNKFEMDPILELITEGMNAEEVGELADLFARVARRLRKEARRHFRRAPAALRNLPPPTGRN
jgi:hypothetical protein